MGIGSTCNGDCIARAGKKSSAKANVFEAESSVGANGKIAPIPPLITAHEQDKISKSELLPAHGDIANTMTTQTSKSGEYTEPTLPDKEILNEDGIKIEHFYKSGYHAPPHLHVTGNGPSTRIGANGKPLKGNPEPSSAQKKVIGDNIAKIRKAVRKISEYQKYQDHLKGK